MSLSIRLELVTVEALEARRLLATAVNGVVWNDVDFDGLRDAPEKGLSGQKVYADYDNDRKMDSNEPSTFSRSDGKFTLANVKTGNYPVRVVATAAWNQSAPFNNYGQWVNVSSGKSISGIEFGVYARNGDIGAVSGRVFNDLNQDGIQNDAEPGIAGRTVFVDYDNDKRRDSGEPRALTQADGRFQINNVRGNQNGRRPVRQILPEYWEQTAPFYDTYSTSPPVGAAAWLQIHGGEVTAIVGTPPDFCQNPLFGSRLRTDGHIVGRALMDEDGNGIFDNWDSIYRDPSITGVLVWLDYDNDRVRDANEPSPRHGSDESSWGENNADFELLNVRAGRYALRMQLMAGWVATGPAGTAAWLTVLPGKTVHAPDLLAQPVGPFGTITSSIFNDRNRDGLNNDWSPDLDNSVGNAMLYVDLQPLNTPDGGGPDFNDPVQNTRYFSEMGPSTTVSIAHIPPGQYLVRCTKPWDSETGGWSLTTNNYAGVEVAVLADKETYILPGFGLHEYFTG